MTISRRLLLVFALFFVVLAGRTVFFNYSLRELADHSLALANETLARDEATDRMTTAADETALLATAYVAGPDPEFETQLAAAEEQFNVGLASFTNTASNAELLQLAATASRQFDDLIRQAGRLLDAADRRERLMVDGSFEEIVVWENTLASYLVRFHILRDAINSTLDDVITPLTQAEIAANQREVEAAIEGARATSLGIGALAAAIMLAAMGMVERRIALPVRRLASAAESIAAGIEPPPLATIHDDEMGRLTATFNEMVRKQTQSLKTLETNNLEIGAQNEQLRELDRLKDHFVATVSHELRTPLTAIIGYTELVTDGGLGPLSGEQEEFLQVVARNAERLSRMVDDLLLAARIEAGILKLDKAPFSLTELLREACESAIPPAKDKKVTLEFTPCERTTIVGDRTRIAQAIDNLISNAIKFTPPEGVVELSCHLTELEAVIEVRDSGIGIPADEQAHIFDRFFRSSISGTIPGTGIGLWLVKYVATAHGGSIQVTSEVGQGSTFTMLIPRSAEVTESIAVHSPLARIMAHPGPPPTPRPREPVPDRA